MLEPYDDNVTTAAWIGKPEALASGLPSDGKSAAWARTEESPPPTAAQNFIHALMDPWSIPVLAVGLALAFMTGSLTPLWVTALAYTLLVGAFIHTDTFRRHAQKKERETQRQSAMKNRDVILVQMTDDHRRQLERMETLIQSIHDDSGHKRRSGSGGCRDCEDLNNLLSSFARMAVVYRSTFSMLSTRNLDALRAEVLDLERAMDTTSVDLRPLHQRHLGILQRRVQQYEYAQRDLEALERQMKTTVDLVHLLHQRSLTRLDTEPISDLVDRMVLQSEEFLALDHGNPEDTDASDHPCQAPSPTHEMGDGGGTNGCSRRA